MTDLGFEDFGMTVALGACFIGGILLVTFLCERRSLTKPIRSLAGQYPRGAILAFAVLSFISGLVTEDLSDAMEDKHWWPDALFVDEEQTKAVSVLSPLGDTYQSTRFAIEVANAGLFSAWGSVEGIVLEKHILESPPKSGPLPMNKSAIHAAVVSTYYTAKNKVYGADTHFHELNKVEDRIDYSRAMILVCLLLTAYVLAVMSYQWLWPVASDETVLARPEPERRWGRCSALLALFIATGSAARIVLFHAEVHHNQRIFGYALALVNQPPATHGPYALPPVSGLAGSTDMLLAVHDFNSESGRACASLGVRCADGSLVWRAASIEGNVSPPLSDVEAVVALPVPGSPKWWVEPTEFLLVESGTGHDAPLRRIAYVSLVHERGAYRLRVNEWHGKPLVFDITQQTRQIKNCEAAIGVEVDGTFYLWIADRERNKNGNLPVVAGRIDFKAGTFEVVAQTEWPLPPGLNTDMRACSDLNVYKDGKSPVVYGTAAADPGNWTLEAFDSVAYRLGVLDPLTSTVTPDGKSGIIAHLPRNKAEALWGPADDARPHLAGADNEAFGGAILPIQ